MQLTIKNILKSLAAKDLEMHAKNNIIRPKELNKIFGDIRQLELNII